MPKASRSKLFDRYPRKSESGPFNRHPNQRDIGENEPHAARPPSGLPDRAAARSASARGQDIQPAIGFHGTWSRMEFSVFGKPPARFPCQAGMPRRAWNLPCLPGANRQFKGREIIFRRLDLGVQERMPRVGIAALQQVGAGLWPSPPRSGDTRPFDEHIVVSHRTPFPHAPDTISNDPSPATTPMISGPRFA